MALGLLLTVVVPAVAALLYFTARTGSSGPALTMALVTNRAEVALAELKSQEGVPPPTASTTSGPWHVQTRWEETPGWASLHVEVSRKRSADTEEDGEAEAVRPEAGIHTGRFLPETLSEPEPSAWP